MDARTPRSRRLDRASRTVGWAIDPGEREALLRRFPPAYAQVVADHVTLKMGAPPREPLPEPCTGRIVGEADDGAGVQCLVVEIEGSVDRWDGGVFHATWSLDPAQGRSGIESNGVIAWLGWRPVEPVMVTLIPGRF